MLLVAGLALAASGSGSGASLHSKSTKAAKITIVAWDWGQPDPKFLDKLNAEYMKAHPNVTIKHVLQPFNSYFTLLRTAVASRRGPDIVANYATAAIFDFYNGIIPLTKYVTPQQRADLTGWGNVSAGLNPDKPPYGVPFGGSGNMWYYNKALFRKAGLNPASGPKTWAEVLSDCAALKKAGIVPIVAGFKDGYYAEWWFDNIAPQFMTTKELNNFAGNPRWTSPAIVKSFQFLLDAIKAGCMTPNAEGIPLFPDGPNDFGAAKGAMFLGLPSGTAFWGDFRKTLGDDVGVFLTPIMPGSLFPMLRLDYAPIRAYSITKWSKHPKEDYDYISFIVNAKNQSRAFIEIGWFPNNRKVVTKPIGYAPADQVMDWVKHAPKFTGPDFTIRPSVEAVMDKVVPSIVIGQSSIQAALQQVQDAQDKIPRLPNK